jgi:CheY-like chemotaxis protein/two-component sensor histidine kinase
VQRLLAFARRQPLQPKPVDVGALVAGMADLVASTSGPQTKVLVDVADNLPAAVADANQLEMAILNLSVNARDAMPAGGRLTISARHEEVGLQHRAGLKPGRYVVASVADTGVGMDAETLKRAIEPFYSTKGVGRGTGLGLSMVHGLAAQLGGALVIDSKPGLGTNVEVWLPASDAEAEQQAVIEEETPLPAAGTALLVDDEELVRASTADMLLEMGYAVVEAGSAEDALGLIDGGLSFDILITDHLMPGMTGNELVAEIRGRRPGLPVLLVSGYADVEGVAPDLPRLIKPFRHEDLAASLAALTG